MSGHSKFSNIKHRKEKSDAAKAKVFTRLGRELIVAVKHGGGGDPAANGRLRDAVAKAKSGNMPNDTIDRIIKKAAGSTADDNFDSVTYEGYGPGGVAVIVEALTDNRNRAAANIRSAFTKGGGNMGAAGCVSFLFDEKGVITVSGEDYADEDALMMLALDSGASDFISEDGQYYIITEPADFSAVREIIEKHNIPASAEITKIPQTNAKLESPDDIKKMNKLLDLLEEEDDVQNVYHNWTGEQ